MTAFRQHTTVHPPFATANSKPQPLPSGAITIIQNFCLIMNILYPRINSIDPDRNESASAALDQALLMYTTIFQNALNAFTQDLQKNKEWQDANGQLTLLRSLVEFAPRMPDELPSELPALVPAETPLELYYEAVVNKSGQRDLTTGWKAICDPSIKIDCVGAYSGLPNVGALLQGESPAGDILVVALNDTPWGNWSGMQKWARNTRNGRIDVSTQSKLDRLHQVLRNSTPPILKSLDNWWKTAVDSRKNADHEVFALWNQLCKAPPTPLCAKGPTHFTQDKVISVVAFTCHGAAKSSLPETRARCRRCRVVCRWPMPTKGHDPNEPEEFTEGPFSKATSCAEVLMIEKAERSGLPPVTWA